jgi:hypothetical protein
MDTPEQVIARAKRDAEALTRRGYGADAERVMRLVAEFDAAVTPIRLVTEATAMARSGKGVRWLRQRHADWCAVGAAGFDEAGNRLYRLCVLPTRLGTATGAADAEAVLLAEAS